MTASTPPEALPFGALRLDWADTPHDVWRSSPVHVEGLHATASRQILGGIADASESKGSSPIGLAVRGQAGSGKTHLLGWVREQIQREGGYFFLVGPLNASNFWGSLTGCLIEDLLRPVEGGDTQLAVFLRRLSAVLNVPAEVRDSVAGDAPLDPVHLKNFIVALRTFDRLLGQECQDTLRALIFYGAADDFETQDVGSAYLLSMDEHEPNERAKRGMRGEAKSARQIVREMSRLLALTGPSVIAIDQIDTLVAESTITTAGDGPFERRATPAFDEVADGLLVLRELTERTLFVLSCLPATWAVIENGAVAPVRDRFRVLAPLERIESSEIGRSLVAKRFDECFRKVDFTPAYPTWPVRESAFADAPEFTPRGLLQRIDRHVESCLSSGQFSELTKLADEKSRIPPPPPLPGPGPAHHLDELFGTLRESARGVDVVTPANEDTEVPSLLAAGLTAWRTERGDGGMSFEQDPKPGPKPALHGRLRQILDENTGEERHWAFRAVTSPSPTAALTRLRHASTAAGIEGAHDNRRLFLLRDAAWSGGAKTQAAVEAFTAAGGVTVALDDGDLRTLAALRTMLDEKPDGLREWLVARQPASGTKILSNALADVATIPDIAADPANPPDHAGTDKARTDGDKTDGDKTDDARTDDAGADDAQAATDGTTTGPDPVEHQPVAPHVRDDLHLTLGVTLDGRAAAPLRVELEALRRHTAIFAGSGSGKTVLIRRLVEECALRGVSSIVLDPNNDLARLGDAWPDPPDGWGPDDADLAKNYLADTDVVVWTPRWTGGRPLTFQPLPDFRSLRDDPDEFAAAVETAVTTLAAKAGIAGSTPKAALGRAVLHEALRHFGGGNRTSLLSFLDLIAELPEGISTLKEADRIAADIEQRLRAVMVTDPLFGGLGEPVDPGLLLTPPAGKRARVSVISMVGLHGDEQRQSFVNQLQVALFAWVKKNPAGDRPLGGLFVMDEAQTLAPSGAMTACTKSTLVLASQARKYGLGLVFATQAPKGLHNGIPGNANTQFFGRLNSPAQIDTAKEMAKAKDGDASDIGKLRIGQFYAAGEGFAFQKVQTPLCLTYHPKSPLTAEEVVERARRTASP